MTTYNKWSQDRSNSVQIKDHSLLQEYIYPKGPKACITRLVYHTKHNKEMKANYAYKLRNRYDLYEKSDKVDLNDMASLNKNKVNSFTVNKLNGVSLVELEHNAAELVEYLERVRAAGNCRPSPCA